MGSIGHFTKAYTIFALSFFLSNGVFAQEKEQEDSHGDTHIEGHQEQHGEAAEDEPFARHNISLFLSHSFISQGIRDRDRDWLVAPSWGLNYNYFFNKKWAIGWHNDLIIEEFVVEDNRAGTEELERSFPFSTLLVGTYRLSEHWGFSAGGGAEWEKNENFGVVRVGAEYGIHIHQLKMEMVFAFNYDILIDAYDSFNLGFGISKFF